MHLARGRTGERAFQAVRTADLIHRYHCWVCFSFLSCKTQGLNQANFLLLLMIKKWWIPDPTRVPLLVRSRFHPGLVNRGLASVQGLWKKPLGFAGTIVTYLILVRVHHWDLKILVEVKFIWHKINHFKVNNSASLTTFTKFCYQQLYLVPKYFH